MAKDGSGKDNKDAGKSKANNNAHKQKPNLALGLLIEVTLAIIVQWKRITECFKTCHSSIDLLEEIAYIILITIGISKPGALIYNLFMRMVDSVWMALSGHPLSPQLNPDVEQWFKVIFSFLIQYGFAAFWIQAKYISACLDAGSCHGYFGEGEYYMAYTATVCGPKGTDTKTCHYIFNHVPVAFAILIVVVGTVWALKVVIDDNHTTTKLELPIQQQPEVSKSDDPKNPKNQMLDAYCPHCKESSRIPVPPALLVVYCKNC